MTSTATRWPRVAEPDPSGTDVGGLDRLEADYVLPLRWSDDDALPELTAYLHWLSTHLHVIVVDGSPDPIFQRHVAAWGDVVRHIRVEPGRGNGKVAGVIAGLAAASHEAVIIADDDVRWNRAALEEGIALLAEADLVRPQNFFQPLPWHARWDTGRSLLNRALGGDYPGTYLVRRSTFQAMGGYADDVLFENLELARTVRAYGGVELVARSVLVCRRPPTTAHFLRQRVRQAYDDFAQPVRFIAEASLLPVGLLLLVINRQSILTGLGRRPHGCSSRRTGSRTRSPGPGFVGAALLAGLTVAVAEIGRRRDGGRAAFSPTAALWAPVWLVERAVCVWLAVGYRWRGGMPYGGSRLRLAAHSTAALRARAQTRLRAAAGAATNGAAS